MKADSIKIDQTRNGFFSPALAPLMRNRRAVILLAAITVVLLALTAAGIIAWQCPVKSTLGVSCPGCGLTRATVLFVQGHWKTAVNLHAFAPFFLGIGIFLITGSSLPLRLRQKMAHKTAAFERSTGIAGLLMLGFLAYWIFRVMNVIP